MSILYIEPFSGLAGDMMLSALCELTDGYDEILSLPKALGLNDGKIEINEMEKNGIVCKHVNIIDLNDNHEHEHHSHTHDHHDHSHHHSHTHSHTHSHSHSHPHRHLKDIVSIIDNSSLAKGAKKIAKDIFQLLGEAESKVHNIPLEKIHFHEVSAVDSILDIVGCAVLLDKLNVEKTFSEPVCTGYGFVKTQHGMLPVMAPATEKLMRGIPVYKGKEEGERLTPTGAAILKYLNPEFNTPVFKTLKSAYGPGKKSFTTPNVVRLSLIETTGATEQMYVLETNIDDAPAEYLGSDFQDKLIQNGAMDFYYTNIHMKKGRPGILLTVFTSKDNLKDVSNYILEHTSTIGLRYYPVSKNKLERKIYDLKSEYGNVKVKEVITPSGKKRSKIEYEDLKTLSEQHNLSIHQLQLELYKLLNNKL